MKTIYIMVKECGFEPTLIRIEEGTGDNLLDEDIEEGFVDYINYETFGICVCDGDFVVNDGDGGMVLCEKYVAEMTEEEVIDAVLDMEYTARPNYEHIWVMH